MLHVQCNGCGAMGFTESGEALDDVVRCVSPADEPEGSPEGLCCADHESHDDHVAHVQATGDASCRPLVITIMPGSTQLQAAIPGSA